MPISNKHHTRRSLQPIVKGFIPGSRKGNGGSSISGLVGVQGRSGVLLIQNFMDRVGSDAEVCARGDKERVSR